MSKIFRDLKISLDETLEEKLQLLEPNFKNYRVLKKSIDARKKNNVQFVYTVEVFQPTEEITEETFSLKKKNYTGAPINIIGAGPAGLFSAIRLLERGIPCRIFERGSQTEKRLKLINRHWRYGELDPNNNVCFGEGGAGLYSDGKLITRIKSPHISYVMHKLVQFGAPEEIKYLANPHVGSDRIRRIIPKLRAYIQHLGGEIHFDSKIIDFDLYNNQVTGLQCETGHHFKSPYSILATGHSARDIFYLLNKRGITIENKDFAMGLRIEHPQIHINKLQYKSQYNHPKLSSANYKFAHHNKKQNIGVYSFCMCPGGYVLSCGTESDGIVCNGMSNYKRNSPYANSAIVMTIKNPAHSEVFNGLNQQIELENKSYSLIRSQGGTKELPAQKLTDFLQDKKSTNLPKGSSPSGSLPVEFSQILSKKMIHHLQEAFHVFDGKMKEFIHPEAVLYGVESRTSSPVRVPRNKTTKESISHGGLYPCGEGAGYAGGITSAACDGVNVADAIFDSI